MEKKCNKCNVVKDVSEFYKAKTTKDGLRGGCKVCISEQKKEYRKTNPDKIKEYRKANKEKASIYAKIYREKNKENITQNTKAYREANKDKLKEKRDEKKEERVIYAKKHREKNKEKILEKEREYREANKDKIKEYYKANKEKKKEYNKQYKEDNKEKLARKRKEFHEDNPSKSEEYYQNQKEQRKLYYESNKNRIVKNGLKYINSRRKTDGLFRLKINTRRAVTRYLRDGKNKRTKEIIGIDFKEFQIYLGKEYKEGTHLDHIIPVSWANNDEEVYILNHYSNFQIITAEENMAKSDSYCKLENLKKVLDNHNDLTKLNKIIERNSDKIK